MLKQRPFLIEALTAIGLILAPIVLPYLGFAPNTVNRILVWGLFGIGFDILFGYTGLLSFGQSAFYGTGGFFAAYLMTRAGFPYVTPSIILGMVAAAATGYVVGLIALRRTGIYFAMITVAIAEVFFYLEFNPLSEWTGGENGLPGVPTPSFEARLHRDPFHHRLVALLVPGAVLFHRHRDRAARRALAGRRHPSRDPGKPVACQCSRSQYS